MSDLLLEIDEELRSQQIKALWDRYGQWVIGLAVLAVIGTGVSVAWHNHMNKVLAKDTEQLVGLLQTGGDSDEIAKKLDSLKTDAAAPLNGLVGLYQAQTLEKSGDLKAARKSYQEVAVQMRQPRIVKELATLQDVRLGLLAKDAPDTLLPKLDKLTDKGAPFYASALELKGLLLQQQGKNEEANKIFENLSSDINAPATLRKRAKSLIRYEGKDAK